jgi:hypothetical protein
MAAARGFRARQIFPAGGRELQDPRHGLPPSSWFLWRPWGWAIPDSGMCGLDLIVRARPHGPAHLLPPAIVLLRWVWVLLASLALALVASGCGGLSPDTRAEDTRIALYGTRTPTPLEAARTVVAMGTPTKLDPTIAASLTAEATLDIVTPEPMNVATHMAQFASR